MKATNTAIRMARKIERAQAFKLRRNPLPERCDLANVKVDRAFLKMRMTVATLIQNGLVSI